MTRAKIPGFMSAPIYVQFLLLILLSACLINCHSSNEQAGTDMANIKSYRDIPGITIEEIEAIENLKLSGRSFSYGSLLSTEAFILEDGSGAGFTYAICTLLSDLFGIDFVVEILDSDQLTERFYSGNIDFTGDFTSARQRDDNFFIASIPIVQRRLSIYTDEKKIKVNSENDLNGLRIGYLDNTFNIEDIFNAYPALKFDAVIIRDIADVPDLIYNGEIDAFITESVNRISFLEYPDIAYEEILPLVYIPMSLTGSSAHLLPIISVLNKYINTIGILTLHELNMAGNNEYSGFMFRSLLSPREREYLAYLNSTGREIPISMIPGMYPVSFFNTVENEFQGIAPDVLAEISLLSGMEFRIVNNENTVWTEILDMLRTGETAMVSELLLTDSRANQFLWTDIPYFSSPYAFISKTDFPYIELYQIAQTRVGLIRGSGIEEMYHIWFPGSTNIMLYGIYDDALDALERDEIDLILASEYLILYQINYREKSKYKINFMFSALSNSSFGFNINEIDLHSIINHALSFVDTERISKDWTSRVYDYSRRIAEERSFYSSLSSAILLLILIPLTFLLIQNNKKSRTIIKRSEQLREAEEQTKLMLDTTPLCCQLWNSKLETIDCNEAAVRLYGFKDKKEYVERFHECSPEFQPDGQRSDEKADYLVKKAFEEGHCVTEWMHIIPNDGTLMPAEVTLVRVNYRDEYVVAGYTRDLREHKSMMASIDRRNTYLNTINQVSNILLETDPEDFEKSIYQSMSLIAEAIDVDGVFIWKNHTNDSDLYCKEIYKWTINGKNEQKEQQTGKIAYNEGLTDWIKILSGGSSINSLLCDRPKEEQRLIFPNEVISILIVPLFLENQWWGFSGIYDCRKERIFRANEELILRSAGKLFTNALLRQEMSLNLRHALVSANAANNAKSDFLAKMSHEIRTPMNAIVGMTELALRADEYMNAREHILTVKQAGANLLSIINDILDFSKIETGKMEIVPDEYRLSSLTNDVISIIRIRTSDSRLRFVANIDSKIPDQLIGDEMRLRQIILNLLGNSVKYTEKGFISLSIYGEDYNDDEITIVIKVEDSGVGIKDENIGSLFKEYTQFNTGRNRSIEGTGLGLAITYSLIKAMDGDIQVKSEFGTGSIFTVKIRQKIKNHTIMAEVDEPGNKSVIIYERRQVYAASMMYSIKNLGLNCTLVSSDRELENELSKNKFDYIFISYFLYNRNHKQILPHSKTMRITVLTEFGEAVPDKNLNVLAMPIHVISIANLINGSSSNFTYNETKELYVRFSAPDARILVVDDISTNLKVAEGLLIPYGMKVDVCGSGLEAIDILKSNQYDLVFMDHKMPGMDGIETAKFIRMMGEENTYLREIPIIALTANAVAGTREMFLESGFNDFMSKPIDTAKMNMILEKWLPEEKQQGASYEIINIPGPYKIDGNINIEGVDTGTGIFLSGGKPELYIETLAAYYRDGLEKIRKIKSCIETEELELYTIHVHALKSASANIGAFSISEEAKALENAGDDKDLLYIEKHNDIFLLNLKLLLDNISLVLAAYRKSLEESSDMENADSIKPDLVKLKDAIISLDAGTINRIIESLKDFTLPDELNQIITEISDCILFAEFDKAVVLIDSLLEQEQNV